MDKSKKYEKTQIGLRLAKYRKWAGCKNAQELADRIDNPLITKSTIVNLELGKKSDMTISELLLISRALKITPMAFICDLEQPFERSTDSVNFGLKNGTVVREFVSALSSDLASYFPKMADSELNELISTRWKTVQLVISMKELLQDAYKRSRKAVEDKDSESINLCSQQVKSMRNSILNALDSSRTNGMNIPDDFIEWSLREE